MVTPRTGPREFIVLMAAMAALDAFSIDGMLPALNQMGADLNVVVENHRQRVITSLFLGFAIGVLFYGFIADRFGRRLPTIAGFLIYCVGSILCITADTFSVLLAGRVLQGFGAAGPYVLSVAIVRDLYQGRQMARVLSLVMMVFIGIPMIAPFIGQGVLLIAGWRSIFGVLMLFALVTLVWFYIRQVETLNPKHRQRISISVVFSSIKEILSNHQSVKYLLAQGLISGAFIAYLSTAQQIFQEMYQLGTKFPVIFASMASLFGIASYFNSQWVERWGTSRMVHWALSAIILSSLLFVGVFYQLRGLPPLWAYLLYISIVMGGFAFLFGNITSLALDPMGHIAGSASSVVNSLSTLLAILLATLLGAQIDGNVFPVVLGFGVLCSMAWLLNHSHMKTQVG